MGFPRYIQDGKGSPDLDSLELRFICVFSIVHPYRLWRLWRLRPLRRPRSPSFSGDGDGGDGGGGEYLASIASLLSSDHICDATALPLLLAHVDLREK